MNPTSDSPNTRDLRDIEWCLHSPPLIQIEDDDQWPDQSWFDQWRRPDHFDFTPPDNHRLGIRFEALIQSWVETSDQLELMAANLPVRDGKRTIGEFDLIVDHGDVTQHWELAVKFYLGVGDTTDLGRFFGPNPIDTLATKLSRLTDHQMQLSRYPEAKALLTARDRSIDEVVGFVKGRLFYPLELWRNGDALLAAIPETVNPAHERGWWCEPETFYASMPNTSRYAVLPKPFWLSPIQSIDGFSGLDHASFCQKATRHRDGTLPVVELDESGEEVSRGFIVYPRWLREVAERGG